MLNEMLQDFHDDVVLVYDRLSPLYGAGPLPLSSLRRTMERVRAEYHRLRAFHPGQFPETLFRIAVCRQSTISGPQLVGPHYVLRLAMQQVADEYRPSRPPVALALAA